jgi:hypothetical protein
MDIYLLVRHFITFDDHFLYILQPLLVGIAGHPFLVRYVEIIYERQKLFARILRRRVAAMPNPKLSEGFLHKKN